MNISYKILSSGLILSEPDVFDFRREISSSLDHRENDSSDEEDSLSDASPNRSADATPTPLPPTRENPGQRTPMPGSPIDGVSEPIFRALNLQTLSEEVDT